MSATPVTRVIRETKFGGLTHAKRTMEAAQVMYGVTMQEPGVSKLVSVRWEGDATPAPKKHAAAATAA